MTIDFGSFDAITFDCYGTLIDWEAGIVDAASALLGRTLTGQGAEDVLQAFGRAESEAERGAFRPYREVLRIVAARLAADFGAEVDAVAAEAFAASVADWPAFPDSAEALQTLGAHFRLAIVSNVDDDLFAGSAARLGVSFAEVVTAQHVRSYKPARPHFDEVVKRLALPRERVLHCAQSLYHDIAPARELGFTCVWVNRRSGRPGAGATPPAAATPNLEVPDMAALARMATPAR
ncbi:MAG: haloacid dehalogenase type II [Gemmatimonadota bacterium]